MRQRRTENVDMLAFVTLSAQVLFVQSQGGEHKVGGPGPDRSPADQMFNRDPADCYQNMRGPEQGPGLGLGPGTGQDQDKTGRDRIRTRTCTSVCMSVCMSVCISVCM